MDCYAKQGYPDGFNRNGTSYPWEPATDLDMSMGPGTVIRPDMPIGSGPARTMNPVPAPIPMSRQDLSAGPCPWTPVKRPCCTVVDSATDNCPKKTPGNQACVKPERCSEMPSCVMPAKCPEKPSCVMPAKCPEKPTCVMPAKCTEPSFTSPAMCPCWSPAPNVCPNNRIPTPAVEAAAECIDKFPIGMAYVPWQTWQQVYSVDTALGMGTIFPDLYKPFTMGGCRS